MSCVKVKENKMGNETQIKNVFKITSRLFFIKK